jgi:RecA-family ATPase
MTKTDIIKDWADVHRAGGSVRRAADKAIVYEPKLLETRLQTCCAADLEGQPVPEREWLIKDVIPHRNVTLLSGDGGLGKTLLALQIGISLSAKIPWLGHATMQGPFLYIGAEDDDDELYRRLDRMLVELDLTWGDLADLHFKSLAGEDALIAAFDRGSQTIKPTELLHKVETKIKDLGAICCALDTSADMFGGDEINRTQVRQFIALLRGICLRTNSTVVLLAHPSVAGMSSGTGISGSTGWNNSVRSRLYLEDRGHDKRLLHFKKQNYGPKGEPLKLQWRNGLFALDDGKASATALANAEMKFLQMLDLYNAQERNVGSERCATFAPNVFARDPQCKGFSREALEEAMNSLFTKRQIIIETFGPSSRQRKRIIRK